MIRYAPPRAPASDFGRRLVSVWTPIDRRLRDQQLTDVDGVTRPVRRQNLPTCGPSSDGIPTSSGNGYLTASHNKQPKHVVLLWVLAKTHNKDAFRLPYYGLSWGHQTPIPISGLSGRQQ
jgi:hypothetical protein